MIGIEDNVSIPSDVLYHELDGEAVLLNLQTGKYFGLDPTGTRIWHFLAEYGSPRIALNRMLGEYDVDAERLKAHLLALCDQLAAQGLILSEPAPGDRES